MCHRSLIFENLKLHAELYGDIYKKKRVVFNAKKGLLSPEDLTARLKLAGQCRNRP